MNLVAWYETYWAAKDDSVDHDRLDLMLPYVQPGQRVFQLDGGPGMLAERMVNERGAEVVMTDLTQEATRRARAKGLDASQLYIAEARTSRTRTPASTRLSPTPPSNIFLTPPAPSTNWRGC